VPVCAGEVDEGARVLKETKPSYTREQALSYLQKLQPLVAQASGRTFTKLPPVKLVTRNEIIPVLVKDFAPQWRMQMPDAPEEQIERLSHSMAESMAPVMLGKYGFATKTLYLLPGNLVPLMKLVKIEPAKQSAVLQLIIAHELTHALQDQQVHLQDLIARGGTRDRMMALNATIEGHAMLVQEQVGGLLKLDAAARTLSNQIVAGALEVDDPMLQMMTNMYRQLFNDIYLGGRDFMTWHLQRGGTDALWRILAAPPPVTAMLYHPER
jgi:hypothetical protein